MPCSNITTSFVDLAASSSMEAYIYGGQEATTYMMRKTCKSTLFTQIPVPLACRSGNAAFGGNFCVNVPRNGDYLLHLWIQVTIPELAGGQDTVVWTPNLMHNLVEHVCITFNGLPAATLTSEFFDFWAAFTVPGSKQGGYDNMIGNIPALTEGGSLGNTTPSVTLNLPVPFFFSRDTGVSLPTAAIPYNEIVVETKLRKLNELASVWTVGNPPTAWAGTEVLKDLVVWGNYAIVSNEERSRMGCAPRDILIEQVQAVPHTTFKATESDSVVPLRFSNAVKVLFFGVKNTTYAFEHSNYTTHSRDITATFDVVPVAGAVDPVQETAVIYENTSRIRMTSDYYSLIQPFYHAPSIPCTNMYVHCTGYHMYSYSLDFANVNPMGSTNYGKLTNVTLSIVPSATAALQAVAGQKFETNCMAVSNTILRVSGGAVGFPTL